MPGSPPVVTGVSPKEGTPLTKVTIRGENLGTSKHDLVRVYICEQDCTLTAEWQSSSKIICHTGMGLGRGEIIVVTKSGGKGSCTVGFTGQPPKKVGPLEKSAVWVDETEYIDQRLERNQKATALSLRSDPLGILSDDSTSKAPSNMNLSEMYPNGSPDPTDENFVPAWYLIERHFNTLFKQLKEGHTYMRRRASRNTSNAPLNHVKDSLPVFFEVQEMLSSVHQRMIKDEAGRDNENITANLESILNEASSNAEDLFTRVLSCKDRADSIRNTLSVLQRFKFLFYLPLNIDKNIKKGDYGVVINDYIKARSLFADTDVAVFKRVYTEVEKHVDEFREKLRDELRQLPLPLSRQKSLIRFLLELQEKGDPAWECIDNQHTWIQTQMLKCKDKYLEKASADFGKSSEDMTQQTTDIPKEFLEELAALATEQIPEHWHLWEQYASGVILSETGEKTSDVDKLKHMASKHGKKMKNMLRDTIYLFVNLLRAGFLPTMLNYDENNPDEVAERASYGIWPDAHVPANTLADCVRTARNVLRILSKLDLAEDILACLDDLIRDLRVLCLSSFMQEASTAISNLGKTEKWDVDRTGITSLPLAFNSLLEELIMTLSETLQSQGAEDGVFTRDAVQVRISELTTALFTTYTASLEHLVFGEEKKAPPSVPGTELRTERPPLERRIIIALSNVHFTKIKILPEAVKKFLALDFPKMAHTQDMAEQAFADLHQRLFESYIENRIEPLSAKLEPGMYSGYFSWTDCLRATGVRPYIKAALTGIITIHAEVYAISPRLVKHIIQETVKSLAEEMLRLMQCIQKFSANGSLQARLELLALQQSAKLYATDESDKAFEDAQAALPQLASGAEKKLLEELLNRFRSGMLFHLKCLEAPIDDES